MALGSMAGLGTWAEAPRTLAEALTLASIAAGHGAGEQVTWRGATREPFLTLQAEGWRKVEQVIRMGSGLKVTCHYWQSPAGERDYLKVKTT